ncbi:glycosyltransferase family 4 protein [Leisingera daeponensis]|uniref:Glycosyltransferase family 4 protein n=1 Tax=Leisingera daeponensis TaxID=405746 RepID=A0ABS7NI28_9RHOB|nr:glycosyltransferase family 4 protein [Leisingera daeponensis]MBY6140869.1 glycosyltransferase family 4 protein [Leisingera daeponensis]
MRLAVIVTEYPKFTETFILRDVMKFLESGADVRLYHLAPYNSSEVLHEFARPTRAIARHVGLVSPRTLASFTAGLGRLAGPLTVIGAQQGGKPVLAGKSAVVSVAASAIARELADWGADHVHAEFAGHPATAAWVIHRLTGIPYSVSCRAHDIFRTQRLLAEKLGEAAFVRTISNFGRAFLASHVRGLRAEDIQVIHSSVDVESIPQLGPPSQDGPFHVVYVGSLQVRKGVDVLLRALAATDIPDWRCSLAGDGPERAELEALAADLGLRERVRFLGKQDFAAVSTLYESANVIAVPSVIGPAGRTEGIPNVAIEGLAFQRPVISTNVSGIPELIRPGETGFLIEPGSVADLLRALEDVQANPAAAYAIARQGRRLVEEEFSLAANARRQLDLFRTHSAAALGRAAE